MHEKKIKIVHDDHGEAQASEHQLEEFLGLGWQVADGDDADDAAKKPARRRGKKADSDAGGAAE